MILMMLIIESYGLHLITRLNNEKTTNTIITNRRIDAYIS